MEWNLGSDRRTSFSAVKFVAKIDGHFYVFAIFNLIFGYFLNLISTDMVALQPVDTIDTLSDLLENEKFSKFEVVAPGGVWHEMVLRSALSGSKEERLYQRIGREHFIPVRSDPQLVQVMLEKFNQFLGGKMAMVTDRQAMPVSKSMACQVTNCDDIERYHVSKDWFGERLLVSTISESSRSELVAWSRYKLRQIFESNVLEHIIDVASYEMDIRGASKYQRLKLMFPNSGPQDALPPKPFTISFFNPLFVLCLHIPSFAFIVLLLECFTSKVISIIS